MGSEYKKIVLLKGLEPLNQYNFHIVKSILAHDLQLTKKMQEDYDRIKIADLMEEKYGGVASVDKLIEIFKDIKDLNKDTVKNLKVAKLKAKRIKNRKETPVKRNKQDKASFATPTSTTGQGQKRKITANEKSVTKKKKVSQEQSQPPCPSGASTSASMNYCPPPQISSSTPSSTSFTENQGEQTQYQAANKRSVLQKGPIVVKVLKATAPFKYESPLKGKNRMFHATVVTESTFFQVKVFNVNLKKKFTPKKVLVITDYMEYKGLIEINEMSSVSEADPDQKLDVSIRIIKRAKETPKIDDLQKRASGTFVYGFFTLHKKKVNVKNTIYEIQDDTGKMDVVGSGKCHNLKCEEGDKLRLFCFKLKTIDHKLKLASDIHSLIKVTRNQKKNKESQGANANPQID
ncbi:myeloid cell nuclear differentiation antigen [Echinops telfairi]|uniref:Myeloid cell nuclear differentiation antigen n=1 Tax=Echinops telfairi TaxID=9371 RepID=A0ABM1VMD7_ECHTE|nr:myeloid cell nuclear differentiation antigen [Echinops telfairi]